MSRVRILDELRRSGDRLDATELARRTGLHPNTVRSHLDVLKSAGLVTAIPERRSSRGRPRLLFEAADSGALGEADTGYRLLARILASYLAGATDDPGLAAEQAGQAWGGFLVERAAPFEQQSEGTAMRMVTRLLERLDFAPRPVDQDGERRIVLHHCPFRELAETHPEVTCAVHLGLIRGALKELGASVEVTGLDPMVTPSRCVAHFGARAVGGRQPGTRAVRRPRRRPTRRRRTAGRGVGAVGPVPDAA